MSTKRDATPAARRTERRAARALLLTPNRKILLMNFRFPWANTAIWITPGGSLKFEEDARTALLRELREETGLVAQDVGAELWTRDHLLMADGETILQRERYFLVRTGEFEPEATSLDKGNETNWFQGFRWWPLDAIPDASPQFAPTTLGQLVRSLVRDGLPDEPFAIPI